MVQKRIRCIVRLSLALLEWEDSSGLSIHLEGPPVFLRACVLGQLQHSRLHRADFPVQLKQSLTFDRILTNCRDPSIFSEVIRGEHVKVELIQVSQDCRGGKILARFDSPAHSFLFPSEPSTTPDGLQKLQLNKSRRYQCPPKLSYSTSTTLVEATVKSPVDGMFQDPNTLSIASIQRPPLAEKKENASPSSPSSSEVAELTLSDLDTTFSHTKAFTPTRKACVSHSYSEPLMSQTVRSQLASSAREERLDTLLKSYSEPLPNSAPLQSSKPKPLRVKFKPPVPRFSKTLPQHEHSSNSSSVLYHSITAGLGSHGWQQCPRRSQRHSRSRSASELLRFRHSGAVSSGGRGLDALDLELPFKSRPEFVVRHPDPSLMAKRDFCGEECSQHSLLSAAGHESPPKLTPSDPLPRYSRSSPPRYRHKASSPQRTSSHQSMASGTVPHMTRHIPHYSTSLQLRKSPYTRNFTPVGQDSRCEDGDIDRDGLMAKYLGKERAHTSGNISPTSAIEEKLMQLQQYCHECKRASDSLGEDDLEEDLERLKASLEGERNETLNRSARMIPQESVVVRIGPEDYWSKRMSEFTGKRHRVLFDETLEKIYSRLYSDAANAQ